MAQKHHAMGERADAPMPHTYPTGTRHADAPRPRANPDDRRWPLMEAHAPRKRPERGPGLSDRSANIIIGVVAGIWAASMTASIVTSLFPQMPDYQPPEYIHGAFLAVVGTSFVLRGKGKDDA